MAFLSFLIVLLTVYVRPGEILTSWQGAPVALIVLPFCAFMSGVAFAFAGDSRIVRSDVYVLAFLLIAMVSVAANGWLGGGRIVLLELGPSILAYFATRAAVTSPMGLEKAARVVVVLSALLAANGLTQYYTGEGLGGVEMLVAQQEVPVAADADTQELRIRGTGIFNDPNDLAFGLLIGACLNVGLLLQARGRLMRLLYVLSLAGILHAFALTRSRGGVMGLAAGLAVLAHRRYGWKAALATVVFGGFVFAALSTGRLSTFNASEASAQGRIESWSAGLQLLKSRPILGVGFNGFTEYHELVAHNSYVHVLAELGLAGGFVFMGLVCFFYLSLWNTGGAFGSVAAAWLSAGSGALAACVFLSRQYSPLLFLLFGISGSAAARNQSSNRWPELHIAVLTGSTIVATYAAVWLLKSW